MREMRLMPHILEMERRGVYIDVPTLESELKLYTDRFVELEDQIYVILGQRVTIDPKQPLLNAIIKAKLVDEGKLHRTAKTGAYSASKDSLFEAITDTERMGCRLVRGDFDT
jgi:DNA polymerase I-like protein with 3'-5' exonuclease and polymerase domains